MVVDYKATAKQRDVTLDADWQIAYKRQMEIYQWLLRANGLMSVTQHILCTATAAWIWTVLIIK